eukprot:Skav213181  [mRNA]  locus=scaffold11:227492:229143:- [translate_table: standard]
MLHVRHLHTIQGRSEGVKDVKVLGCLLQSFWILPAFVHAANDGHHKAQMAVEVDGQANFGALLRSESFEEEPENLVKNGDFEADPDMKGWKPYKPSKPRITHIHRVFGQKLMHLHGWCPDTSGGVEQEVKTVPGRSYTLKWLAYSGHWDGKKAT